MVYNGRTHKMTRWGLFVVALVAGLVLSSFGTADVLASGPHPSNDFAYMTFQRNGSVGGVAYRNEDVVAFNVTNNAWELVFDGSAVGVTGNVNGISFDENDNLLFTLAKEATLPGLGLVDDSDIIRFTPTTVGDYSAGTFDMVLDGSTVGLTTNGEDIDSLSYVHQYGYIIMSTAGKAKVQDAQNNTVVFKDEDLFIYNINTGAFERFIDGASIGLDTTNDEDVWAIGYAGASIYISTKGNFDVTGVQNSNVTGTSIDLMNCTAAPTANGPGCYFYPNWAGGTYGIPGSASINGLTFYLIN